MPFVLDGNHGQVDISAHGQRHEIIFGVDQIRQEPAITHTTHAAENVKTGTTIKVWWPVSACSILTEAETRFLQLADDYTWLNPHLTPHRGLVRQRHHDQGHHPGVEEVAAQRAHIAAVVRPGRV